MKLVFVLTLLAAALAALPAAAGAGLVVRGDERLAGYRVKADGTLGGARAAFGRPSRLDRTSGAPCVLASRAPSAPRRRGVILNRVLAAAGGRRAQASGR